MVKFNFFVTCSVWKDGGYINAHFAENEQEAKRIVDMWNKEDQERVGKYGCDPHPVKLLEIKQISDEEFAEDYIY